MEKRVLGVFALGYNADGELEATTIYDTNGTGFVVSCPDLSDKQISQSSKFAGEEMLPKVMTPKVKAILLRMALGLLENVKTGN